MLAPILPTRGVGSPARGLCGRGGRAARCIRPGIRPRSGVLAPARVVHHRTVGAFVRAPGLRLTAAVMTLLVLVVDAALAARADLATGRSSAGLAWGDLAVGLSFIVVGLIRAPSADLALRSWVFAVGTAWWADSWVPGGGSLHRGVVLLLLLAFPSGSLRRRDWWWLGPAALVASGVLRADAAALVFLGVVVVRARTGTSGAVGGGVRWYPVTAALAMAALLGAVRWWEVTPDSPVGEDLLQVAVDVSVLLVAALTWVAIRELDRRPLLLADHVLSSAEELARDDVVDALAAMLRRLLDDPSLTLELVRGEPPDETERSGHSLVVEESGRPVALVRSSAPALRDRDTEKAIRSAVALVARNALLREEQRQVLAELTAARLRLLTAADDGRRAVAAALCDQVAVPLRQARSHMAQAGAMEVSRASFGSAVSDDILGPALAVVTEQTQYALDEIEDVVAGVPPVALGGGRLAPALTDLVGRSSLPVALTVGSLLADPEVENTVFYVCSEGLSNVAKHARATWATIEVRTEREQVVVTMSDDGVGGADPHGRGLSGLADRVAAHGGRFRVESPPGTGTRLTATVPFRRPSSRA